MHRPYLQRRMSRPTSFRPATLACPTQS